MVEIDKIVSVASGFSNIPDRVGVISAVQINILQICDTNKS